MPRNNQQDTASWDAREVRRAGEQRPREKRRRRVRLVPYLLFVVVVSAILAGSGWLLVSEFCSFNRAPVEAEVEITAEDVLMARGMEEGTVPPPYGDAKNTEKKA